MRYLPLAMLATIISFNHNAQAKSYYVEKDVKQAKEETKAVISDSVITAKTKDKFFRDPDVSALKIHVTTKDHVVYLKGKVDTEYEQMLAVNLAREVEGVKRVDYSDLKLAYK